MKKKIALITGVTGQDGSYLSEYLLKKGYEVHGIKRKSSSFNTNRIDHLYKDPRQFKVNFFLHYGDLTDPLSLEHLVNKIKPNEIYNLAAQSHVATSFEIPAYTCDVNALGTLRLLEAIKKNKKKIKFYQASSSEMYGDTISKKQNESTVFRPKSPYATSKLFSYWIVKNYRDSYGIHACNGILFNHESPRRGETFVTKKITRSLVRIMLGIEKCLVLGNLYSKRDWGHAADYAKMMWKILQYKRPDDFVISSERQYTVKDFINLTCKELNLKIKWTGSGLAEKAIFIQGKNHQNKIKPGQTIIKISKQYFRPNDVDNLLGDSTKAKKLLRWKPKYNIHSIIKEMINDDLKENSKL